MSNVPFQETIFADPFLHVQLTGNERFPVIGGMLPQKLIDKVQRKFQGFPKFAGCLEKNTFGKLLWGGKLVMGSLEIYAKVNHGRFSYQFNPPTEFHAWLVFPDLDNQILDLALPGAIQRGLSLRDELGSFLEGRKPVILAGHPPAWLKYKSEVEIILETKE
jgi:hypothetical protein